MIKAAFVVFGVCLLLNSSATAQESSPVDFNGDGEVNFADFIAFARGFGKTDQDADFDARLDLNNNGEVDFQDFVLFARQFGGSSPSGGGDEEPFDPRRIYVADFFGDRVFVLDGDTNMFNPGLSVAVRQPRSVTYSYRNRRFYVAGQDSFYALTESSEIDYRLPLQEPPESPGDPPAPLGGFRMVLSPDHQLGYVAGEFAGVVEVIHLKNAEAIARIPLAHPPKGIAISPDGGKVFVAHTTGPWISVIDGPGQALVDSIRLDGWGNGRVAVSPEGDRIYTATTFGDPDPSVQIVSIDPETKEVVDMLEVAADSTTVVWDVQASRDGHKLFATVRREFLAPDEPLGKAFAGYFWTIDAATFERTSEIQIRGEAVSFSVSRDGKTAYAIVNETPFVALNFWIFVIDLENEEVLGRIFGFLFPTDVKVYGAKPALGRTVVPEITIF